MLRLAQPTDLDAVYAIYMHPDVVPYLGYEPLSLPDFRPIFQELIECRAFYILERDGAVAGFCRATRQPGRASHVVYLGTFAVSPQWRGTGLAREFMEQIIEMLESRGALRLELMLEADNPRAFAFYSKLGFVQEGLMRAAYKRSSDSHYTDEIFMAKLLTELPADPRRHR